MCFPFFPPLRFKSLRYFALASLEPKTLENIAVYIKQSKYILQKICIFIPERTILCKIKIKILRVSIHTLQDVPAFPRNCVYIHHIR